MEWGLDPGLIHNCKTRTSYNYPVPDTPFQEGFDYDDYDPYDVPEDQKAEILPG